LNVFINKLNFRIFIFIGIIELNDLQDIKIKTFYRTYKTLTVYYNK